MKHFFIIMIVPHIFDMCVNIGIRARARDDEDDDGAKETNFKTKEMNTGNWDEYSLQCDLKKYKSEYKCGETLKFSFK